MCHWGADQARCAVSVVGLGLAVADATSMPIKVPSTQVCVNKQNPSTELNANPVCVQSSVYDKSHCPKASLLLWSQMITQRPTPLWLLHLRV